MSEKTVEEILGIGQISIPELDEKQKKLNEKFPVGCRVVLHGLPGAWAPLVSLTGTVWRHTADPMWSHVIEIDHPMFIPAESDHILEKNITPDWAIEWCKANGEIPIDSALTEEPWLRKVTVHGSALHRLDELADEQRPQLNYGRGERPSEERLSRRRFVRAWEWISLFAKQDLYMEKLGLDKKSIQG